MSRPKSNNVQINISIPMEWKTELENLARIYSVEEGKTITFLDLMRRGIQEILPETGKMEQSVLSYKDGIESISHRQLDRATITWKICISALTWVQPPSKRF